jgi:hypothetical protein
VYTKLRFKFACLLQCWIWFGVRGFMAGWVVGWTNEFKFKGLLS